MMLVSHRLSAIQSSREATDEKAKEIVMTAFFDMPAAAVDEAFDAALKKYLCVFPHVPKKTAKYAVSYILDTFC
ncbi:MAG TPA: hypothetical protein VHY35_14045 [Stellaceae bacterium]|jgi:hypothetical protein|nr:hypothetical protein [Stellaceae bacterium]